jgi:hypothetical protein
VAPHSAFQGEENLAVGSGVVREFMRNALVGEPKPSGTSTPTTPAARK